MGIIKNIEDDELIETEYDETLWEVIDIPKDVWKEWYEADYNSGKPTLTETLHYIGPVVDGKVECKVPRMDLQYHTFAGCRGLKEIPVNFEPTNYWEPFYECADLAPEASAIRKYWSEAPFGTRKMHGSLLLNCGAKTVLNQNSQEAFLEQITGHSLLEWTAFTDCSGCRYDECGRVWFPVEDLSKVYQVLLRKQLSVKEGFWVTDDYGILEVALIDKASELPSTKRLMVTKDFVICCNQDGSVSVQRDCTTFVGIFSQEFENDTLDTGILSVRPQAIHGKISEISTLGIVEFDGDTVIEASEGPAVKCVGVVTLKGTGNITLRGHGIHPALGVTTYTGMSFGRWSPGDSMRCSLKKVIIDGVHVKLESDVPNFTIGSYGRGEVPEIECVNGGTIDCPEMKGERVMVQSGEEGLYGSTKRVKPAIYELRVKPNPHSKSKTSNMNFF